MKRRTIAMISLVPIGLLGAGALATGGDEPARVAEDAAATVVRGNPLLDLERPRGGEERLVGRIVELERAGAYTYASVDAGDGAPRWVVMLRSGSLGAGDRVVVKNLGTRRDFRSRRLGRSFDELMFGVVRAAPAEEG
jgi:hypothetical protein